MRTCSLCGTQVGDDVAKCPRCHKYSEDVLLRLLRDPAPEVRERAAKDLVFLTSTDAIVLGLAEALRDPVVTVRQAAGLELFICGADAKLVTETVIAALGDPDVVVRRLAAGILSNIGPPAGRALPLLAELHNDPDEKLRYWAAEAERTISGVVPKSNGASPCA